MSNVRPLLLFHEPDVNHWVLLDFWPEERQLHKMVKHTKTTRRVLPTNCLSVFVHFVGLALKELTKEWFHFQFSLVIHL